MTKVTIKLRKFAYFNSKKIVALQKLQHFKIRLILKSFQTVLLYKTIIIFKNLLTQLFGAQETFCKFISLPKKIKRFCLLRSPHIDKDSREHLEIRISKVLIDFPINFLTNLTPFLLFQLPAAISVKMIFLIPVYASLRVLKRYTRKPFDKHHVVLPFRSKY
jgi:small subunit ribosomal protein S10